MSQANVAGRSPGMDRALILKTRALLLSPSRGNADLLRASRVIPHHWAFWMTTEADECLRRQRSLADFGEFALQCNGLRTILQEGCRLVAGGLDADLAKIVQIEQGGEWGLVRAGVGWNEGIVGHQRLPLSGRTSFAFAKNWRRPAVSDDVRTDERFDLSDFMRHHGVVAFANAPQFDAFGCETSIAPLDH